MAIFLCDFHAVENWSKDVMAKIKINSEQDKILRNQAKDALRRIQHFVYMGPPPSPEQLPSVLEQLDDDLEHLLQQLYTTYAGQPAFVAYVQRHWGGNYSK